MKELDRKQVIFDLSENLLKLKFEKAELEKQENILKEEIRGIMIELDTKYLKNENIEIKLARPYSFDIGMLKYSYPEIASQFVKTEVITKEKDYIEKSDMKHLKEYFKEAYLECNTELTPRLTIKRNLE